MSEKTLFQKIADREIPAQIVYEDELCLAFHDIDPKAPIHVLIVPKKPIPRVGEAQEEDEFQMPTSSYGHSILNSFASFDWSNEEQVTALLNTTGQRLMKTKLDNAANGRIQKHLSLTA